MMDKMSDALGLAPLTIAPSPTTDSAALEGDLLANLPLNNAALEVDCEIARKNLMNILAAGDTAMSSLKLLAAVAETPHVFDAMSKMIATLTQTNAALVDIHRKKAAIYGATQPKQPKGTAAIAAPEDKPTQPPAYFGSLGDDDGDE